MGNTTKTLILILFLLLIAYICFNLLPYAFISVRRKIKRITNRTTKKQEILVNSFLTDDHPGAYFVALIHAGMLGSIKTKNHGFDFPDDRQLNTFKRFSTQEIKEALDRIGEGI